MNIYLYIFLLVLGGSVALLLLWQAGRIRRGTGIPFGEIIYKDSHAMEENTKSYFDKELGLAGRPDYLIKEDGYVIPVEVKSTRRVKAPYDSHIYQLAAYCLLVESNFEQSPPFGILAYPDKQFRIPFTETLRQETIHLISEIRGQGRKRSLPRSHEESARCRGCGYKTDCGEELS